jgi:hypothetical protein
VKESRPPKPAPTPGANPEAGRLAEDAARERNWKRWGPYLSERQWGTVREDYSPDSESWGSFGHEHAPSRAYRWGEDGLLGITDRQCRLAFALALWNERDPILKERLFGLAGPQGNHGEDVKEIYFYLDSTPTHSYLRGLYKYPQAEFPYARLVDENRRRGFEDRELELIDTGVFDGDRYFDVFVEYAKASPGDIAIRVTVHNRGPDAAPLHVLPTLWFRNTWSWGRTGEAYAAKPRIALTRDGRFVAEHAELGRMRLAFEAASDGTEPEPLFTENESNFAALWGQTNPTPYVKDAFHRAVVRGETEAVSPERVGTKAAPHYRLVVPAGGAVTLRLRLSGEDEAPARAFGAGFDRLFEERRTEADAFYDATLPAGVSAEERNVLRQGYAGLLWSKQFYHYVVQEWLEGDPAHPAPPDSRKQGRNADWRHLYNRDVISMPDSWEYPWYAAWDLAFHMIAFARVDPQFAKEQLLLLLREWYMHPNGQIPAYEYKFCDVNPPVHAWAAWRVYKMTGAPGKRDRTFLRRVFDKLVINFTWWVNRKDAEGNNVFGGGFLGMDNIGIFDRSKPLPTGGHLEQADGTAWMAFYCATMLSIALELAQEDPVYEDVASKFFEHFVAIVEAMNGLGGTGLWCDDDGFYYDQLHLPGSAGASAPDGRTIPLRVRSMVGLLPLVAVEVLEEGQLERLPGFAKRMRWFLRNRPELARYVSCTAARHEGGGEHRLLAIPTRDRLERVLARLLDEREFLSPHGVRSLSRAHAEQPYTFHVNGDEHRVGYEPGEGRTALFGGNSNWRGPIWFPVNFLLVEALERYHHFFGDALTVELPTGSGRRATLGEASREIARRLGGLFLPDASGVRPCHHEEPRYARDPHWKDLVTFHEYFHGDTGRGLGARFQGWTMLALRCIEDGARERGGAA